MVRLYGQSFGREEVLRRVGDMRQICGIDLVELSEGKERGTRAAVFRTGSGFEFTALPDRSLDIAEASWCGTPISWTSPTGRTAPSFYDSEGLEWLRSFYGGLLVTCGLTYAGAPCEDEGEELGLHGRVSNIPARRLCVKEGWEGDEYSMRLSGEMVEAKVFDPPLVLTRELVARAGESKVWINDTVENRGYSTSPHMMIYHMNMGFPVVDDGSELVHRSKSVKPRDDEAERGIDDYASFSGPQKGYEEQVFYHDMETDAGGLARVGIVNRDREIGIKITYRKDQLPRFVEWKMMGEGTYVVGLEPSNCWVEGRDKDRERGILESLEPGERRSYELEFAFLHGEEALNFADGFK